MKIKIIHLRGIMIYELRVYVKNYRNSLAKLLNMLENARYYTLYILLYIVNTKWF